MEKEFIEQIEKHIGIIHKICGTYFYGNPNKEDYFQEILIRLWKAYPNFKRQAAFSTWMYRVALNAAIDLIRKASIQPLFTQLSNTEMKIATSDAATTSTEKEQLYFAISQLNYTEPDFNY